MRLRGRAGNFCHRSIDLIELVTNSIALREYK